MGCENMKYDDNDLSNNIYETKNVNSIMYDKCKYTYLSSVPHIKKDHKKPEIVTDESGNFYWVEEDNTVKKFSQNGSTVSSYNENEGSTKNSGKIRVLVDETHSIRDFTDPDNEPITFYVNEHNQPNFCKKEMVESNNFIRRVLSLKRIFTGGYNGR